MMAWIMFSRASRASERSKSASTSSAFCACCMHSSSPCFTPGPCRRRHGDTVRAGDGGDTETRSERRRRSRRHIGAGDGGDTETRSEQETAETRRHCQSRRRRRHGDTIGAGDGAHGFTVRSEDGGDTVRAGDGGDTETRSERRRRSRRHIGAGDGGDTETRSEQETAETRRHCQSRRRRRHGDTIGAGDGAHGFTVRSEDGGDTETRSEQETAETRRHGQSRRRQETRRHSQRGDVGDTEIRSEQETEETRRHGQSRRRRRHGDTIRAGDDGDTETHRSRRRRRHGDTVRLEETAETRSEGRRRRHGDTVRAGDGGDTEIQSEQETTETRSERRRRSRRHGQSGDGAAVSESGTVLAEYMRWVLMRCSPAAGGQLSPAARPLRRRETWPLLNVRGRLWEVRTQQRRYINCMNQFVTIPATKVVHQVARKRYVTVIRNWCQLCCMLLFVSAVLNVNRNTEQQGDAYQNGQHNQRLRRQVLTLHSSQL